MKQTGIYLVVGGTLLFIIVFIGKIISFILNNPMLGLAITAVIIGLGLVLAAIYSERKNDPESQELEEVNQ